jgi:hypothetical protein
MPPNPGIAAFNEAQNCIIGIISLVIIIVFFIQFCWIGGCLFDIRDILRKILDKLNGKE